MSPPLWAIGVSAGVRAAGSRHVIYVPDNPLTHVIRALGQHAEITTTIATREEEALGIAAGLYLGGARPTVLMQSSGLGNSINAIASLLVPYQIPVLIVVSMRGEDHEWNAAQVSMGQATRQILGAVDIPHTTPASAELVADSVATIGHTAFATRRTGACLLPRRLTAPPVAIQGAAL